MDFVKKNYEKILLSLVLLGLAAAAALMPMKVSSVEETLQQVEATLLEQKKPKPYKPVDTSTNEAVLASLKSPAKITLTGTNNLLNPVKWIRRPNDTRAIKMAAGNEFGPAAVVVDKIEPLFLRISYEGMVGSGDSMRYQFSVTREAESSPGKRRKTSIYGLQGSKNEVFLLKEVKGSKEDPTEFTLVLNDDSTTITLPKSKEVSLVSGYMADLRYPPDNLVFPAGRRVGDQLKFGGETKVGGENYKIVAITEKEVTLSAISNGKNTTVRLKTAP